MTLAILSPNENVYSETFIQAHKSLPFRIRYYCNGRLPTKLTGKKFLVTPVHRVYFKLISLIDGNLKSSEQYLRYSLKNERVSVVLAEYGVTAAESLRVIQSLQLPLVVHFHGYDASDKTVLLKYQEKYLDVFQYAKFVVSVSKKMSSDLISLGCPSNKIVLNTCGPNLDFFSIKPSFKERRFAAVGRFVDKKAPYLTIIAFSKVVKRYPDAKLFFGGEGQLLNSCKNLAKVLKLQENVFFLGKMSKDQIMSLFSHSLAFVQHSITAESGDSEGTPVSILEASAAGLPVVATRHAGIPDAIEHGIGGFLVEELDIESMANCMMELCENPEKAKLMGSRGSQNILLNFSIEKHLVCLAETIKKAIV